MSHSGTSDQRCRRRREKFGCGSRARSVPARCESPSRPPGRALSEGVKYWILPDIENRIKAGQIRASFRSTVRSIASGEISIDTPEGPVHYSARFVFILAGYHPDVAHLRAFGIDIDPETLAPRHDQTTFETNIPGLYVAGSAVAGKFNNRIFIENGRLHGGVIVKAIRAAGRVKP